jgi:hypothetical protein
MVVDYELSGTPPMHGVKLSSTQWLEYIASYQFGPVLPTQVVLHHTWRPTVAQWQGATSMRGMQRYFAGLGWTAAPHVFAAPDGIWLFTPLREVGVHAGTGNGSFSKGWYTIGLEMVGDYDNARPSGAVWEHTLAILGGLSLRLNTPPAKLLKFHRDFSTKTCPGKAVTPAWVIGELEAWLKRNPKLPFVCDNSTSTDDATYTTMATRLLKIAWRRNGNAYENMSPMAIMSIDQNAGIPLSATNSFTFNDKNYLSTVFVRDTYFIEVPNWSQPSSMWQLIGNQIPAANTLARELLDQSMRRGGTGFRENNPFHLFLFANRDVGPPIAPMKIVEINGQMYHIQVCAGDTLYIKSASIEQVNWKNIKILSNLGGVIDAATVAIRDTLIAESYRTTLATYYPERIFHQLARAWAIGTPFGLSGTFRVNGVQCVYQVYANDVLFVIAPKWNTVHRLSTLVANMRRRNPVGT